MNHHEKAPDFEHEPAPEERETMVEAIKISTVFSDQKVLEQVADTLLSQGLISGFHIDRILSGYIYHGKKVEENQYSLEILLDSKTDESVKGRIRETIASSIGEEWDVPAIEEEPVKVNKELFGFIQRAEIEHSRYVRERKLRLTIALSALLSISATLGTFTKKYFDDREQKAVAAERAESYDKIRGLEEKVSQQVFALDAQIASGKPLTISPSDMAAMPDYEETQQILQTVRDVQAEMEKLKEESEKK